MNLSEKLSLKTSNVFPLGNQFSEYSKSIKTSIGKFIPKSAKEKIIHNKILRKFYSTWIFFRRKIRPGKSPRVYIKKGYSRMAFFDALHQRKIEYVLLRWWEDLPEIPPGEDMDILIKDEHRDLISDLITFKNNGTELKCDIYTVAGSKYGSHKKIPYFQTNLAATLIKTRVLYRGAYVPSPILYFASLSYHAVFHKGHGSGLSGFKVVPKKMEHDYPTILNQMAIELGINIELNPIGIYKWLKEQNFAPADDTLSKLIEIRPELFFLQKSLYSDIRGGELIVYVIRERLSNDGLLPDFTAYLEEKFEFDILEVKMLNSREKEVCRMQIRGGKWDRGPFKFSGGPPVALVVAYDYHPTPLKTVELKKQSRTTNRNNLIAKYRYRERNNNLAKKNGHYNGVHSSDNEPDARYYVSLLGDEFYNKVSNDVEIRRQRYARKWVVKKTLSAGPIYKTELIHYGEGLAVKKTFRVGKERFFERELFAVKKLSKELPFIPPLWEEGDGYVVVPYFENILDTMSQEEKKQVIVSKENEIINVIRSMHARGLVNINFTPANIIVTQDNRFFCNDFSYLQKYTDYPSTIEQSYEVAGLPRDFEGDCPANFSHHSSSYDDVWGSFIGHWGEKTLTNVK